MNSALRTVVALPIFVAVGIVAYLATRYGFDEEFISTVIILAVIFIGSARFIYETVRSVFRREFGLDYIALAAILTAFFTGDYLVGSVIVLMLTTGDALEDYAAIKARSSLTALVDRIPKQVSLVNESGDTTPIDIENVQVGQSILVRRGEVVPLDGVLLSDVAQTDESSLTGEPYLIDKHEGDILRSGTVNAGDVITMRVTVEDRNSTYRKIIALVKEAENTQAPLVRLADRYSVIFTIITAILAVFAYTISDGDWNRVLAVLVVATPCPLLLATPIALIGGMSASAKEKIILKKLASLEVLSRVQAIVFDKTGTITLGQPTITEIRVVDPVLTKEKALSIANAIEHNSLHPIAKAIVHAAKEHNAPYIQATEVREEVGTGISGVVEGRRYLLSKHTESDHLVIVLQLENAEAPAALFSFEDQIKLDSKENLHTLKRSGFEMYMLTGDKQAVADKVARSIDAGIIVQANAKPEEKMARIQLLKSQDKVVAMVGDGINDAPALAAADVGIVFSNEEHTAASEAADIVLLGGDFALVLRVLTIAKRTIRIALQSIWVGIGLSVLSMIAASFGLIPPLIGSIWQEVIDIIVIVNALRASRITA